MYTLRQDTNAFPREMPGVPHTTVAKLSGTSLLFSACLVLLRRRRERRAGPFVDIAIKRIVSHRG